MATRPSRRAEQNIAKGYLVCVVTRNRSIVPFLLRTREIALLAHRRWARIRSAADAQALCLDHRVL
jgi:hypothetical protein